MIQYDNVQNIIDDLFEMAEELPEPYKTRLLKITGAASGFFITQHQKLESVINDINRLSR